MTRVLDVAVAGCGPAGLATALLLRRGGHRVTIFERFAEPRPVGSGLMIQPTGLAVLQDLGLASQVSSLGARVERLFGRAVPSGRVVLDVRYAALGRGAFGLGIHRAALFSVLFEAAQTGGIAVETGRSIRGSEPAAGGGRSLLFANGRRSGPFDLVVDALGTGSPLSSERGRALRYGALWASLDWPADVFDAAALEQRYRRASDMIGVLPTGPMKSGGKAQATFFWSLPVEGYETWRGAGLRAWADQVTALWPETEALVRRIDSPERLTLARYAHRTLARPIEAGLIHLGDAWHATSPQLGQGANMALLDAYALNLALRGTRDVSEALALAVALRRRHIRLYQALSLLFTPVYQSDGRVLPLLRDRVAGPLSRAPPFPKLLAATVSGLLGRPLKRLGLRPDVAS